MRRGGGRAARSDDVRLRNRAALISALREDGPRSRTALAAATGLSAATVSAIGGALLEEGVLAPVAAEAQGGRGRPQAPLGLNPARATAAAIVVSNRAVDTVVVDYAGDAIGRSWRGALPRDAGPAALFAALAAEIDAARAGALRSGAPALAALTIAWQGVADAEARRVVWSPIIDARGVDFAGPLAARCGGRVAVMNDAAMVAEAFLRGGARRSGAPTDLALLLVGPGVGMGLVLDGAAAAGRASSAMEFGHMTHVPGGAPCACGRLGCVEAYAADYAILRAAGRDERDDPLALAQAARDGDRAALAAFAAAGEALGYGLGRLFALLGPLPVALAGSGAAAADLLRPAMAAALKQALAPELSGPLELSVAGDATALALEGAAAHALRRLDAALAAGSEIAGAPWREAVA